MIPSILDICTAIAREDSVHGRGARNRFLASLVSISVVSACGSRSILDISGEDLVPSDPQFEEGDKGGHSGKGGRKNVAGGSGDWAGSGGVSPHAKGGGSNVAGIRNAQAGGSSGAGGRNARGGRRNVGGAGNSSPECPIASDACVALVDEGSAKLCNGLDDDCDGAVDESCPCVPGTVQPCFAGPPGRRNVGACRDGSQQCISNGRGEGVWGACTAGIAPTEEVCDDLDNDCNGCVDDLSGCDEPVGSCPGPGDPRVPDGQPFAPYRLKGEDFYPGKALFWSWKVEGGPCDEMPGARPSFELSSATGRDATFTPRLSGDYRVHLAAITEPGEAFSCTFVVHVDGPGLRIEMCYPESKDQDLDLYLKQPGHTTPWFVQNTPRAPNSDQCDWHNCEAVLRGSEMSGGTNTGRADWGYSRSPIAECGGGPQGVQWNVLGYCANPRLDIDNNLSQGIGLPENINVDAPREGDRFRIMVQNFSGPLAHPIVNIHCGGHRVATYGVSPDELSNFQGYSSPDNLGAMWRVADVTTHVDARGETTCEVLPLHPEGAVTGYRITLDDPSY